jgi:hypothetical protein
MKRIILFLQVLLLSASCIAQTVYTNVQKKSDGTNALTGQISIPSAQTFAMNGIEVMNGTDNGTGIWNFSAGTIDLNGGVTLPAMGILMPSCSTIAALKALPVSGISTGYAENVLGYYAAGDAAGTRTYVYNSASSSTDNGGTVIAPNAGAGRWLLSGWNGDVRDFGAIPAGSSGTDLTSAVNAAITAAPNFSRIYFPGNGAAYRIDGPLSLTNQHLSFVGDGSQSTTLITTSATNAMISANGGGVGIYGIRFVTNSTRTIGARSSPNPVISLLNTGNAASPCLLHDIFFDQVSGDGILLNGGIMNLSDSLLQGSNTGSNVGVMFHAIGAGLYMSNDELRPQDGYAPVIWIQGVTTTDTITGCQIEGGGPLYTYTPSAVTSNGTTITVSLSNTTGFYVNDYIVLSGMTTTTFNGFWRITAVSTNTSVSCVATPFVTIPSNGTATVGGGVAMTPSTGLLIDNALGPCNESTVTGCHFDAFGGPIFPLQSGIYIDGSTNLGEIEGWQFTGNYFDHPQMAMLMTNASSSGVADVKRITITGAQSNPTLCQFFISRVPGVQISNVQGGTVSIASGINFNCGIYVYSDGTIESQGFQLTNSNLGVPNEWNGIGYASSMATYGLVLDGQIGIFGVSGSVLCGQTASVNNLNSGSTSGTYLIGSGSNLYLHGTTNPPTKDSTPVFFP